MPQITIDLRELKKLVEALRLARLDVAPALARTMNWVGDKATTRVKRALAKQMGITYARVGQGIATHKANPDRMIYEIVGSGRPIPLVEFSARQTAPGVTARPWGQRRLFRGTFLARGLGGGQQVFRRVGRRRLPIEVLWGPAIPRELLRDKPPEEFEAVVADEILPRLVHEVGRTLKVRLK